MIPYDNAPQDRRDAVAQSGAFEKIRQITAAAKTGQKERQTIIDDLHGASGHFIYVQARPS